ncbi:TonB-linked outer membrane protein, SusC/RagA family [Tangfeifania diversioriginum]|uniref:TonB-linked outer membrane protein, SusC/RagA family n=1 Tax=Tangfeifania diversioriginum TaxID=1168035 RepID=A0A1M6M806_9BACT|nr:SusC/RagA family TonB-linked outer membrane protein [Tangfeifania diversioriginum]SHJ79608.1 TonB-linked outer membrane protein, SusC/RagA family [Tangfeifania diversioriginum]
MKNFEERRKEKLGKRGMLTLFLIAVLCSIQLLFAVNVYGQQTVTVGGTVTDSQGLPLPGATVMEEGTTNGTTTNSDGVFTIEVSGNATLTISFVGMKTQHIAVNSRSQINIQMEDETIGLEEVVAIGYGTESRHNVTSSISSVKGENVENLPASSVDNLLQGRAAGVQVLQTSGEPGSALSVRIRGNTSIGGGNEPLYVVDGVPIKSENYTGLGEGTAGLNSLSDINPNDIASIEILKDAASTSIYGARASNGVVLITTKRGQGKPRLNVNFYSGIQNLTKKLPVLNSRQHREYFTEAWLNRGRGLRNEITDSLNYTFNGDTDWQKEIFRQASVNNVDLSYRGASENFSYSVSGGYFNQEGILLNSNYERFTGRINVEHRANKVLTVGSNLSYSYAVRNTVRQGLGNHNPIYMALRTFAFNRPTNITGALWEGGSNPIRQLNDITNESNSDRLIANIFGEIEVIKNLKWRSNIAIDLLSLKEDRFTPSTLRGVPSRQALSRWTRDLMWINENTLNYSKLFNDDHYFNILAGFSQQMTNRQVLTAAGSEAPSDKVPTINASASINNASSFESSWSLVQIRNPRSLNVVRVVLRVCL